VDHYSSDYSGFGGLLMQKIIARLKDKKTEGVLAIFASLIIIIFSMHSCIIIGPNYLNLSILAFGAIQPYTTLKIFRFCLFIAAYEFFIFGVIAFFSIAITPPDSRSTFLDATPYFIRLGLAITLFLIACYCSSLLLKARKI
jgi:hypothetical protein